MDQLIKPRLVPTHGVYYPETKRATTACIRINAYCYYCKKAVNKTQFGKYTITVNQSNEEDVMKVEVKHSEHSHQAVVNAFTKPSPSDSSDSKSNELCFSQSDSDNFSIKSIHQITGSEREHLAKEIILNHRG